SHSATISEGETASDAVPARGYSYGGVQLPGDFTGENLSFEVSVDGAAFSQLRSVTSDAAIALAVSAGKAYPLPPEVFCFAAFKLVSDVAEAADRVIALLLCG